LTTEQKNNKETNKDETVNKFQQYRKSLSINIDDSNLNINKKNR
jgi:hypothetical protein